MNGDDTNLDKNAQDSNNDGLPAKGRTFDPMFAQSWQKPQKPKDEKSKTPQPPSAKPQQPMQSFEPASDETAEDMLFSTNASVVDPMKGESPFDPTGRSEWPGRGMTPDEMGVPVPAEPGFMQADDELGIDSEQELELIDSSPNANTSEASNDGEEIVLEDDSHETEDVVLEDEQSVHEAADAVAQGDDDLLSGEVFVLDEGEPVEAQEGGYAFGEQQDGDAEAQSEDNTEAEQEPEAEEGWEPLDAAAQGLEIEAEDNAEAISDDAELSEDQAIEFEEDAVTQDEFASTEEQAEFDSELQGEEAAAPLMVAEAPRRTGRILRFAARLAAAAILVGGGAVVVVHPEWVGLTLEPELVERVQVARPNVNPRTPKPIPQVAQIEKPAAPAVEPAPLQQNTPVVQPVAIEPTPVVQPEVTPVVQPEAAPQPTTENPIASANLPRYLPAGENLWVGEFDGGSRATAEWASVTPGSKAFAQLQNGNFFIGSVKAVAQDAITLSVKQGEVFLAREEIKRVTTLDSRDYADLQRATQGFLKLSNDNRLVGEILQSVGDDHYVIQMHSDRIVVPRSAVQQVVERQGAEGVRFGTVGDEEQWLRGVAERQLESQRVGGKQTNEPKKLQQTQSKAPTGAR